MVKKQEWDDGLLAVLSAGGGAVAGYGTVIATQATAIGILTKTAAGIGAAAGPVGAALGAVAGLAGYGIYKAIWGD